MKKEPKKEKDTKFYMTNKKRKRNLMLKLSKPIRDSKGKIVVHAQFQNPKAEVGKVYADRKWFKETRTISKEEIDKLNEQKRSISAYEVMVSKNVIPFIKESTIKEKIDYKEKKKININSLLLNNKNTNDNALINKNTSDNALSNISNNTSNNDTIQKGISKRIWKELFKVIDCSDVIIHVLDSRDPLNTKCNLIEKYINEKNKKLIYILNKVDLVPFKITNEWQKVINKKYPCLLFHSNSIKNNYGKNNLISLLKQIKRIKEKEIAVGFVGYPNVGKSSIINTLRDKAVCSVAPVPGQTKHYQYINLSKEIFLIDSPGVVPVINTDMAVLKGAIRIENVKDPESYVHLIFKHHKKELESVYGIKSNDPDDFLELFSKKYGKLMKGGIFNTQGSARIILNDYVRGKIPFFNEATEEFYKNN